MIGTSKILALGMVLVLGIVVAACAPEQTEGVASPGEQAGATPVATAPAGEVAGAQATPEPGLPEAAGAPTTGGEPARDTPWAATPGVGGIPGNPEGAPGLPRPAPEAGEPTETRQVTGVDLLIDDIGSFNGRLDGLTGDTILPFTGQRPMPSDLTGMTQQARTLLRGLEQQFEQMSEQDREDALAEMSEAIGKMATVIEHYVDETRADITAAPAGAATPAVAGTPGAAGMDSQQVSEELQQVRAEIDALDSAQPSAQRIAETLHRMERVLDTMRQQPARVEAGELQALSEAMGELLVAMESFAEGDYAATGETAPGAPAPDAGAPAGTGASPTPQP